MMEVANHNKLMERMYRLFIIRQRSEKEIRDYFKVKNYESKIKGRESINELKVEDIINKLKEMGLINDGEFAKAWVESRRRKYGINRIKQELFQKGIDRETIEEVISHQSLVIREEQIAEKALEKKLRIWNQLKPQEFRKKATEYLMRKGFEYSVVKEVVDTSIKKIYNGSRW